MKTILTSTLLILLLINPLKAHIFYDMDDLYTSRERGRDYSSLYAGKVVVTADEAGNNWLDWASAVPLNRPGEKQSNTIFSCAHTYIESLNYTSYLFYCDSQNKMHKIKNVLCYGNDRRVPEARDDIGLHYLDSPVSCNPFNEISRDMNSRVTLSTVSFGYSLFASYGQASILNSKGTDPYYVQNTFDYSLQGTYVHNYTADRVVSLCDDGNFATGFLAEDTRPAVTSPAEPIRTHRLNLDSRAAVEPQISYSQTYYHDSGSSWFIPNANGGFTFSAMTSRFTPVESVADEEEDMIENLLSEVHVKEWSTTACILRTLKLKKKRPFQNILTALTSELRDWIYLNLAPL